MKIILMEEPEVATVGAKGQVVIPQQIRKELGIRPKTKLVMYSRGGKLVAARIDVPAPGKELKALFQEIDERFKGRKRPSEREILAEIRVYRKERRAGTGA